MTTRRKPSEVQVEKTEDETSPPAASTGDPEEYVTMQQHRQFEEQVRLDLQAIRERLDDVEVLLTQPEGAVRFMDVLGPESSEQPPPNGVQRSMDRGDDDPDKAPWFEPGY